MPFVNGKPRALFAVKPALKFRSYGPTTKAQLRDFRYSLCLTIDKITRGCPETRIARAAILPHTHTTGGLHAQSTSMTTAS